MARRPRGRSKAERRLIRDPRTACFYARRALELAVAWVYKHDAALHLPYQDNLSALIHEPTFKQAAGEAVFNKAGSSTPRQPRRPQPRADSGSRRADGGRASCSTSATGSPAPTRAARSRRRGSTFDPDALPQADAAARSRRPSSCRQLEARLARARREARRAAGRQDGARRGAEAPARRGRRGEEGERRAQPDTHDYSEAETRDYFIDLLLKEAGWPLDQERDREFEVTACRTTEGKGFVDYVLWGDDGKPLALVEAKRTTQDPRVGQQQAKLYADCLEQQFGQRPVIFYSNGYEHWIWDDTSYPPRAVQGFYKKDELELLIQRRTTPQVAGDAPRSTTRSSSATTRRAPSAASREAFESDHERKALLVMATGAGKTRTVIALVRPADALQLGQAGAVPRRPRRAGEPGGRTRSRRTCPTRRR